MSGLTPVGTVTLPEKLQKFAIPKAVLHASHEELGLGKPPETFFPFKLPPHSNPGRGWLGPAFNDKQRNQISSMIFWACRFVALDADIRVQWLLNEVWKVRGYAQKGFQKHREYINALELPKVKEEIKASLNNMPKRVLEAREIQDLRKQLADGEKKTKNLEGELVRTQERVGALEKELAQLKALVMSMRPNL